MARIPEAEIERIKQEVDLAEMVRRAGVELRVHGDNLIGLCIFHPDNDPSLVVTKSKNLFHCLGCGAAGSVIDWVMKRERVSFRHAVEILRPQLSSLVAQLAADAATTPARAISLNADDQTLLNEVVAFYHERVWEAQGYLHSRGLDGEEANKRFKLGFANRTLGFHLPGKQWKAGKEIRARLTAVGILRESGHEVFRGSLVIPIFDETGNVVGIYGRKVTDNLREGTPQHMYLKGKHRGVWNWQGLVEAKAVILCEALIDALTFYQAGFTNVTASYGVNGFTDDHTAAFKQYGTEQVLIAYDADEAGNNAAQALAEQLTISGINCYRIEFPAGYDANEYACEVACKPDANLARQEQIGAALAALIERAAPMGSAPPLIATTAATEPIEALAIEPQPEAETTEIKTTAPVTAERRGDAVIIHLGDRSYRVYNLDHNTSYGQLKINLMCARGAEFHLDTIDLAMHRDRKRFWEQAAHELGIKEEIIKRDLGRVLFKLEELQDELIKKTLQPKTPEITITETEREAALAFLTAPNLLDRIIADYRHCGIVGEETNLLVGYLAAVSRLLDEPLAVIIQSSSAAGKTALMEAVLELMASEQRVKYSAMTGQSLFYLGQKDLKHKILAIVEQEGAEQAAYALKLLQSEGELTIASTGKDANTGRLVTHEYRVEGPVMIFITTTAIDIDPELLNRCLVLTVNESREQTRAIHKMQRERETLAGLFAADRRQDIIRLHQNAQRLLRSVNIVNPYAHELTFLDDQTRTRRDHMKYVKLIRAITLLHQYQRPLKQATQAGQTKHYIEVTIDDIEIANELANEVMGRTLDELPPQTRRLALLLHEMVAKRCEQLQIAREDLRFTGREVREYTGMGHTQVKLHLQRLVELEYVIVHRGGRGQQFVYELIYDGEGQQGERFLPGLINVEKLRTIYQYDGNRSGEKAQWSGSSRGEVGVKSAGCRDGEMMISASINAGEMAIVDEMMKTAYIRENDAAHHNHNHNEERGE